MENVARLVWVRWMSLGFEERCSWSWWVMLWERALNLLFMGRPEAAFTLSDHLVRISSRHGSNLGLTGTTRWEVLLIIGLRYFEEF